MKWLKTHPSLAWVLALNLTWMLIALASSERRPWGEVLWGRGEESLVEWIEVALLGSYALLWARIGWRLGGSTPRLRGRLAWAMVLQLVVVVGEELDWGGALHVVGLPYRDLRMAMRGYVPQILDSPLVAVLLLAFLLSPLVPIARVRALLERAAPVRAERMDAYATLAGPSFSLLLWPLIGNQGLAELQQLSVHGVLGVVTVRVLRATETP